MVSYSNNERKVMASTIEICTPEAKVLRVGDLTTGTCYEYKHRFWIKLGSGYSVALDDFVSYPIGSMETVERTFAHVQITLTGRTD